MIKPITFTIGMGFIQKAFVALATLNILDIITTNIGFTFPNIYENNPLPTTLPFALLKLSLPIFFFIFTLLSWRKIDNRESTVSAQEASYGNLLKKCSFLIWILLISYYTYTIANNSFLIIRNIM